MRRLGVLAAAALAIPAAAMAQTAGQQNAAALIAHYESSGNPTSQNPLPGSTSSGLYGFLNGTWSRWAPQAGVSLSQYPTAASAPASVQTAVFYKDFNTQGFADWTCAGCDARATAAIQAAGGTSAFAQGSTSPSDYAAMDAPGGVQNYFAQNGGSPDSVGNPSPSVAAPGTAALGTSTTLTPYGAAPTTGTTGTSTSGTTSPTSTTLPSFNSTPGPLSTPFTLFYSQVITATQQEVTSDIGEVQVMVNHYLLPLVTLAFVVLLIRMLFGRYLIDHVAAWVVKLAIIVPLVAASSTLYQQYVAGPVFGLPQWWSQYITSTGGQFNVASPAVPFDKAYTSVAATEQGIWKETHGLISDARNAVGLFAARSLADLSLGALFVPVVILTLLSDVLVIFGPVLIPFALFHRTAFLFWNWVWAVATVLLSLLAIDIVLSLYMSVVALLMQDLSVTGTADNDAVGFWSAALIMVFLGLSVAYVPALITRIGTGVSVSMASASYFMSAGPIRDTGMRVLNAPSNLLRRWTGI